MSTPLRTKAAIAAAVLGLASGVIITHEGVVKKTYADPVFKWKLPTACVGHTGPWNGEPLRAGQIWTDEDCKGMLKHDLQATYVPLTKCLPEGLPDHVMASMVVLAFNTGPGAVCNSSIPGKLRAGNIPAACATIITFNKSGGKDCNVRENNCYGVIRYRIAATALCEGRE